MSLVDPFGRNISYLRLSVTDRCDFRCVYCMAEDMTFLPRAQILTLEESAEICRAFIELGVSKVRITGGEPLIRQNIPSLFQNLSSVQGLDELTLTTNGSRLTDYAGALADAGVKRINVSLDTLNPKQFKNITRFGHLETVLEGIATAKKAGIERIKLNAVMLRHYNLDQLVPLLDYALNNELDITFIEEMPLGQVDAHNRELEFIASAELRELIGQHYSLIPSDESTGGPSRYWRVDSSISRIGFISPHSENFCSSCNRVRVTAEGKLLLCLGNENAVDLRSIIRRYPGERERLKEAIVEGITHKPEKHYFDDQDKPQIVRFMNTTGG